MVNKIAALASTARRATSTTAPSVLAMSLSALLVCSMRSVQAFQSPGALLIAQHKPGWPCFNQARQRGSTIIMRYQSPWDLAANGDSRKREPESGWGSMQGHRSGLGSMVLSMPGLLDGPLTIGDPEVTETDNHYTLTFKLPTSVREDGLDVSVSGRLLTIEARVTQEHNTSEGGDSHGWVTRSSRTHSCARSFVLPANQGVSSHDVKAKWVSEGTFEVKLDKVNLGAEGASTGPIVQTAAEDSGGVPVECKGDKATNACSPAEGYLSGLNSAKTAAYSNVGVPSSADLQASDPAPAAVGSLLETPKQNYRQQSLLAAFDEEFRQFAKAMFSSYDAPRFPTEEQVAATVAQAREERFKRMTAMRRATMATDVSEKDLSYVVRVSLPEGATRKDVTLAVTPDNTLRVSFAADGRRAMYKDVLLPWDALASQISAKFEDDTKAGGDRENSVSAGGVCCLEVTVGREAPPQPKTINIE